MATPQTTRPTPPRSGSARATYVVFQVDEILAALPVEQVHRTLPFGGVTRIPRADPGVLGVFQHAGALITVWDARQWFQAGNDPPAHPWILVVADSGKKRGILVDRVVDVLNLPSAHLTVPNTLPRGLLPTAVEGRLATRAEATPEPDAGKPETDDAPVLATHLDPDEAERRAQERAVRALHALPPIHVLRLGALFRPDTGGRPS